MFRFFRLFRSSQHLHHSIILFLLLLLSIGPVSSQEVTPEPQPSPTVLPTSTLPPPPTATPIPTNTDLPPPTATPLPTNTETPTATSTSIPTNTVTLTPTEEITPTPSPSITTEPSLSPSPTVASRATQVPLPSETPFVPSPTPSARDTLQSAQPQAFSFSSSLPINTINLSPGSDDSDLIAALVTANQSCSNHTVINLPAGQTYTLTSVNNTFFGGTGLPVIVCEVTINGDATQIIRGVGAPNFRIFGVNNPGILRLNGIEVRNGYAADTGGGGILNVFGGQVYLNNSVIANNVTNQTGSPQTLGAGIYSYQGTLYIENSRIANNLNLSLVGDGGGVGVIDAVTTIIGSDFADNGTTRDGGGIALLFTGLPSVNNSCITGNDRVNTSGLPLSSNGLFAGQGTTDATDNWWGASNGPSGPGLSGSGDFVYGNNISVNPFQTASIPCGPQPPICPAGGTQSLSTNSACVTPTPTPTATSTFTPTPIPVDCDGTRQMVIDSLESSYNFRSYAVERNMLNLEA